jgi:hypothetical protein
MKGIMMSERMKVLIAYDGSSSAQAALEELPRAGLPREVEAVVLSVVNVDLPPVPAYEISAMSVNDRLSTHLRARVHAHYDVVMKERDRALFAVNGALRLARRAAEQIRSEFPTWDVRAETGADSPASAVIKKADDWGAEMAGRPTRRLRAKQPGQYCKYRFCGHRFKEKGK